MDDVVDLDKTICFETLDAKFDLAKTTCVGIIDDLDLEKIICCDTMEDVYNPDKTISFANENISLICGGNCFPEINTGGRFSSFDELKRKSDSCCAGHGFAMKIDGNEKLINDTTTHPHKSIRYQCKHAGKQRIRGNAKIPVQHNLASGCEAVLRLHLDSTGEQYVVTKLSTYHYNILSSSTLGMYSSNKRLNNDGIEEI